MSFIVVVDPDGREHRLDAPEGWRVMEIIRDHGLPMKGECGGSCACATCHVYVDPNWEPRLASPEPEEEGILDTAVAVEPNSRLSCQILFSPELEGLRVRIAPDT